MLRTALTEALELKYPILQGGMGPNDTLDLAIAVSRAGALGTLSSHRADDHYAETRRQVRRIAEEAQAPFAINQPIKGPEAHDRIRAAVDECRSNPLARRWLKAIVTSAGDPTKVADTISSAGLLQIQVVSTVHQAIKAAACGCQMIIAEGYESGGHVATKPVHTMVLVPAVAKAVGVPVIAAGGLADGRGLAAALALGAVGIQMGTRFYLAAESTFVHPNIIASLLAASQTDTLVVEGVYGPNRHWDNDFARRLKALVASGASHEEVMEFKRGGLDRKDAGDPENAGVPIGMVVGSIDGCLPVAEILADIEAEAEQAIDELASSRDAGRQ